MCVMCFWNNNSNNFGSVLPKTGMSPHRVLCLSSVPIHLVDASDDCKHMHSQSQSKHMQYTTPDNLQIREKKWQKRQMLDT